MSLKYDCYLDVNEDNFAEYNVSSSMQSFRCARSMDMVIRMQTAGRLEAVFESYDDDFLKLFKHGRKIELRARRAVEGDSFSRPILYSGYIREVTRLPAGKQLVLADYALAWLHYDDDTATYVDFLSSDMVSDVLSRGSVFAPWHQVTVNPAGLVPGTYQFGVLGDSVLGSMTLLGAYSPRGDFERAYQRLTRVDAIVLDVDSADRSGSVFSLLSKAVLSEGGYLFVNAGRRFAGDIVFLGRYGRAFSRMPTYSDDIVSWNGVDYAIWRERVSELTVLSPSSGMQSGALFKTLRNFHLPPGGSFFEFESYVNGYPIEITGGIRLEGLPAGVQCFPSFNGFHLYLQFENAGRERVIIEELSIYANVIQIESVSRQVARTGHRGGRRAMLEFANLSGEEDILLEHYIEGFQSQNELGAIYLLGANVEEARRWDLMEIVDLKKGDIDEAAYIQSMEWTYQAGISRLKIGLWPFTEYNYALVGVDGHQEVGEVVAGI